MCHPLKLRNVLKLKLTKLRSLLLLERSFVFAVLFFHDDFFSYGNYVACSAKEHISSMIDLPYTQVFLVIFYEVFW